ncbi:MAG: DUF1761 domain-containing protein [Bacteroidetes bacterium]|nr:DUF1761 domain-containing protein [Bacteroidota bacterium]
MKINFLILLIAALIPMILGFIWYNPKVFGSAWMRASGLNQEKPNNTKMGLVFTLSFLLCFLMAFIIQFMVIHQYSVFSIFMNEPSAKDPNSEIGKYLADFMLKYGQNFRTFKHGTLHGTMGGIMLATPIITISALFEQKSFKYIAINAGYWIISMGLMGGIICAFA